MQDSDLSLLIYSKLLICQFGIVSSNFSNWWSLLFHLTTFSAFLKELFDSSQSFDWKPFFSKNLLLPFILLIPKYYFLLQAFFLQCWKFLTYIIFFFPYYLPWALLFLLSASHFSSYYPQSICRIQFHIEAKCSLIVLQSFFILSSFGSQQMFRFSTTDPHFWKTPL